MTGLPILRNCGKCSLCCKLLAVPEIQKLDGQWCSHCRRRHGCAIYDARPTVCREFVCRYLVDPTLNEDWNPARAHFLLRTDPMRMIVQVDLGRPDVWKREPYHSALRGHARHIYPLGGHLIVKSGDRVTVMLPDRDVELGACGADERVAIRPVHTPVGLQWEVAKVSA